MFEENKQSYDESQIQVLEGLEAVRKKTGYVHRYYKLKRTSSFSL